MDTQHITTFYLYQEPHEQQHWRLQQKLAYLRRRQPNLLDLRREFCFYVATTRPLREFERRQISWLLSPNQAGNFILAQNSHLRSSEHPHLEIGPRLGFCSPFSTNATSILRSSFPDAGFFRIERSTIYQLLLSPANDCSLQVLSQLLLDELHDDMLEMLYPKPLLSFNPPEQPKRAPMFSGQPELQPCAQVHLLEKGEAALRELSQQIGLSLDEWDVQFYTNLFTKTIGRNPTLCECFDLAQSNSEHSRHWFFKGLLQVSGRPEMSSSLIELVASTQLHSNPNNILKFEDNSSAIRGFSGLRHLRASQPSRCGRINPKVNANFRHILFTAETHNFPTGVAPFPGAATGVGGRIRDVQATGRGAHVIAGTAGYSFGNLLLDDHELDWENPHELYPLSLAQPVRVAIEASNGASDYGNKFGEPIIVGFARSFGLRLYSSRANKSERWEYIKPIMFTGGIGAIDEPQVKKLKPETGMKVAKLGGPVYRIGIGGGAASSADAQSRQLNLNAVQRGDPEMEQKLNRVIRACIENQEEVLDEKSSNNPILSIHDQGAGGNCNVLKEIVDPLGATIEADRFTLGDQTINILELWAAEYQESNAILMSASDKSQLFLEQVCRREKCQLDIVGRVDNDEHIKLVNFSDYNKQTELEKPINLKLEHVIGSMPRKEFKLEDYSLDEFLKPAKLIETEEPPKGLKSRYRLMKEQIYTLTTNKSQMMSNFEHLLQKVLKLPSVASKRYLTTKVDRCVTGLIAGQQCLGPLHTPIADYALVALSHFGFEGAVTSIGEQPIKGLVSPVSNGTMSVAEALTNMMFCVITSLEDVKCSANWMWAAKLPGEGAKLLDTCQAMCNLMIELGIAVDGGKDSLSMSANVDPRNARKLINVGSDDFSEDDTDEIVKSPGTLVVSAYAPVPDIRCKVTPILSCRPKRSHLIYVNLSLPINSKYGSNKFRLGGSAILQTLGQIGDEAPSIDHPALLRDGFNLVQELIKEKICTAGHDVSDGGLVVCALEMALASHCGIHLNIKAEKAFRELSCVNDYEKVLGALFSEECAVVIEVEAETESDLNDILTRFEQLSIQAQRIGFGSFENQRVSVKFEQQSLLEYESNHKLRDYWESTSKYLDLRQANPRCVQEEYENMSLRPIMPEWKLSFDPNATNIVIDFDQHYLTSHPKVAVLREEGINGDREMIASLIMAGFEVYDVTVTDLTNSASKVTLGSFVGLIFPGGFSYADVFGSGRGWAASLIYSRYIKSQLNDFRNRAGTFSLGVCNGCQLMALLGFLDDLPDPTSNRLITFPETSVQLDHNESGRFECRFVNVKIVQTTNSIMLKDMEDSTFGVWVAHGEGKFIIDQSVEYDTESRIALQYVNDRNEPTQEYPFNPNGSHMAAAGLCSRDGRHLAMMPHPERCTQLWQWPYLPSYWTTGDNSINISPWMQMFVNAYEFCQLPQAS